MGITHLPALNINGVPTQGIAGIPASVGNYWFVNSVTGSDGNTGAGDNPFATLKQAIASATANNGDVIVLEAGHAETITAAGGVTVNKAGLTIWPLGEGSTRPTFTFTTSTAATFVISSASTVIGGPNNLLVTICNIASQVTVFSVSAADVWIYDEHHDTSSTVAAITSVTTTAAAVRGGGQITYFGFTANSIGTAMLSLVGSLDSNWVVNVYGAWSTAVVNFITTASINVQIYGFFWNFNTAITKNVVDTVGGSTWAVSGYDGIAGSNFDGGSNKTPANSDAGSAISTTLPFLAEGAAVSTNTGVMVSGATIFTVAGGPIMITGIASICQTANNATASTLQYSTLSTLGALAGTISGASATLASAAVGTAVVLNTAATPALTTAPVVGTTGVGLSLSEPIIVQAGTITLTIGVGSTTGTWRHYIRYKPLSAGVTVV